MKIGRYVCLVLGTLVFASCVSNTGGSVPTASQHESALPQFTQPSPYIPTEANLASRGQFQDDKFGVFIHWGIYSMLAHGEWVMNNEKLNAEEYSHLAAGFYPSKFDADQWVKAVKASGARYITITSRHHDGFSMFGTKASPYNIVDATPFGRDILKELSDACAREGIHLHIYYSHLDWTRADYPLGRTGLKSGRPTDRQDYDAYLGFMKRQLYELLTGYGPVRAIWFDGWWDHDSDAVAFDWRLGEQYAMIHGLQPSCLVLNNHHQVPFEGEDLQGFEQDLPGENTYGLSGQKVTEYPLETCLTMNDSWGYDIRDKDYKSSDELIRDLVKAAGKNCNLLLNVGPRPDGQFPAEALERLQAIGKWMECNGESIYGTRAGIIPPQPWGVTTQKGNVLYLHILNAPGENPDAPVHAIGPGIKYILKLPLDRDMIQDVEMFCGKGQVGLKKIKGGGSVNLGLTEVPSGVDTIVKIILK